MTPENDTWIPIPIADVRVQVRADRLLESLNNPELVAKAKEAGWNIEELKQAAIDASEITLETRFDIIGHEESWRNYLAAELNKLLEAAGSQSQLIQNITVSVVSRVAQFEEIQVRH